MFDSTDRRGACVIDAVVAAPVAVDRHYRVTSDSAKAIESPPSDAATAWGDIRDPVFRDGFESVVR
jgi:hypothetical protein